MRPVENTIKPHFKIGQIYRYNRGSPFQIESISLCPDLCSQFLDKKCEGVRFEDTGGLKWCGVFDDFKEEK